MSVGKNIKKKCKELNISVSELSRQSSIKDSTLRDLVEERTITSVENIKKIAIALQTTTDKLIFSDSDIDEDDEIRILFIKVKNMKMKNKRIVKEIVEALVIKNKNQELENK